MEYGYNLFGLKVNATFKIEGFASRKKYVKPDTRMKFGFITIPPADLANTVYKPFSIFNRDVYYLNIPSVAKFYISKGNHVCIEPVDNTKRKDAIVFFKDTILSILLVRNNLFPINASTVRANDGVYLFCAPEGEGKSSLAAKLCLKGYQFIGDDKSVLTWDKKNKYLTSKSYSSEIELWKNVFRMFEKQLSKFKKKRIRKNIEKYSLDFSKKTCRKSYPIKAIFIIDVLNEKVEPSIEEIRGFAKLKIIRDYVHMNQMIAISDSNEEFFKLNSLISNSIPIIKVTRSRVMPINNFAKFIDNEICTKTAFS